MRKIERLMLDAIRDKRDWVLDNTCVFYLSAGETGNPHGSRAEIMLYGHTIAEWWYGDGIKPNPHSQLAVNVRTLRDWPTKTTISRLRTLGADITVKDGQVYLDGEYIGGTR